MTTLDEVPDTAPVLLDPIYGWGRAREYEHPAPVPGTSDTLPAGMTLADTRRAPFAGAGRLSVWRPGAPSGQHLQHGTASFIAPDLLLTAAHMVWWNEGAASGPGDLDDLSRHQIEDHRFVPAYAPDATPGEVFEIDRIGILRGWPRWRLKQGNTEPAWAYDVAILRTTARWNGPVTPLAKLQDGDVDVRAIGYPKNFHGGTRMICASGQLLVDGLFGGTVGMTPNPMGEGASGGPWVVARKDGQRTIGVTSFPEPGDEGEDGPADDSPVFGDAVLGLFAAMRAPDA